MSDQSPSGIHRFWVGIGTKYGCSECKMAGDSAEGIDHTGDCSVGADTDRSEEADQSKNSD